MPVSDTSTQENYGNLSGMNYMQVILVWVVAQKNNLSMCVNELWRQGPFHVNIAISCGLKSLTMNMGLRVQNTNKELNLM